MTPLRKIGEALYYEFAVDCFACAGLSEARFVYRADRCPPPEKHRKRRCPACAVAARRVKGKLKANATREAIKAAKLKGREQMRKAIARKERRRRRLDWTPPKEIQK